MYTSAYLVFLTILATAVLVASSSSAATGVTSSHGKNERRQQIRDKNNVVHRRAKAAKVPKDPLGKASKGQSAFAKSSKSSKSSKKLFGSKWDQFELASELASNMEITVRMGDNFGHDADCSLADWKLCYTQMVTLEYNGAADYHNADFAIYFSAIHRLLKVDHPDFDYRHVQGDLTYIAPTESFSGMLRSGDVLELPMVFEYWQVQETDIMPNWFVYDARDGSTAVVPNTATEDLRNFVEPFTNYKKTEGDANIPMTPQNRFDLNAALGAADEAQDGIDLEDGPRLIPKPYKINSDNDSDDFEVSATEGFRFNEDELNLLGDNLKAGALNLMAKLGISTVTDGGSGGYPVSLSLGELPLDIVGSESYTLAVTEAGGAQIVAADKPGLFYGVMSLIGLTDTSSIEESSMMQFHEVMLQDKPRFEHRGHQIDSARNFRSKETVKTTIDAMALYKLNVLHFALTNDEGWRLQIPGLRELTDVGGRRCFDPDETSCLLTQLGSGPYPSDGSGDGDGRREIQYYTRSDYMEILKYAAQRNVKVVPEFNMPAHARAAVVSMEARYKLTGDASYRLLDPEDETHLLTIQFYDRTSIVNPCLDSSVAFVEKLVKEVVRMHDDAGVPLDSWHFGGDEAKSILLGAGFSDYPDDLKQPPFSKSPACLAKMESDPTFNIDHIANYWAITVNGILKDAGIEEMFAWEDGIAGTTKGQYETPTVTANFWQTLFWGGINGLVGIASRGFDVVMSNPDYLYFDFPYEVHPEERGYYWAARFNSVYKVFSFAPENLAQNAETSTDRDGNAMSVTTPDAPAPKIRGMQGQTWSETIRTDEQYFEMAFPRTLSIAERSWHRAEDWELDWTPGVMYDSTTNLVSKDALTDDFAGFVQVLGCREVAKMEKIGITYRVPPPGGMIDESGMLHANSELPCGTIAYSVDDGETWEDYEEPVEVGTDSPVWLVGVSPGMTLESRVVIIDGQ